MENALPTFLVVGAVKAGTTSLHEYLMQHPDIYMSPVKETNFFSDADMDFDHFNVDYRQDVSHDLEKFFSGSMSGKIHIAHIRSWDHYKELFRNVTSEKAIGEVSNSYLYCPLTASAIRERLPDAQIVMVLRNPVDRLFSQYVMNLKLGKIIERDLLKEIANDRQKEHKGWGVSHLYVEVGMYAEQVKRYMEIFPSEQIKVILFDDFKKDSKGVMTDLFKFLGVEETEIDTEKRYNEAGMPRFGKLNYWMTQLGIYGIVKRLFPDELKQRLKAVIYTRKGVPRITKEERKYLEDLYREDIEKLSKLIDRDLSHWFSQDIEGEDA